MEERSLAGFMKPNKIVKQNIFYAASKSFVDAENEPLLWEMKPLTSDEDAALRAECYKQVPILSKNGKPLRGQTRSEFQPEVYTSKLAVATVVFPDLLDTSLQDSYGVKKPVDLLQKMLDPGELTDLKAKSQEICGFSLEEDDKEEQLVEDAKN